MLSSQGMPRRAAISSGEKTRKKASFQKETSPSQPTARSPDERVLVVAHGRSTLFYDLNSGKTLATVTVKEVPDYRTEAMRISPDGRSFAVGDNKGTIRMMAMSKLD